MIKSFKVAEHVFQLEMPDNVPVWPHLTQYDPFVVDNTDNPVFRLELVQSLPERELVTVYDVPLEPGEPRIRLYRCGDDWRFETAPLPQAPVSAWIEANSDFTSARFVICDKRQAIFAINNALMLLYAFRTATMGTLEMHASVTVCHDRAFLFLAKSGTGKSTHSSLWLKYVEGSHLLNDDNPVVRVMDDGRIIAFGTPWSGKTPCYKNESYPVGAFVQIRRCPENRISRLSVIESYALIYSSSSGFKADRTMADGLHESFSKILESVPCYVLDCRPDEEAARVSSSELLANCK